MTWEIIGRADAVSTTASQFADATYGIIVG
jgi:hypothetical protein